MNPGHSMDLRRRIVACVESGASMRATARRFAVSPSSVIKLMKKWRATGSLKPAPNGHRSRKLAGHADWLHEVMAGEPDITLQELQKRLSGEGVEVSLTAISDMLQHLGYSFKKKPTRQRTRSSRRRRQTAPVAQLADLAQT